MRSLKSHEVLRGVYPEERLRRSETKYRSLIQGAAYGIYRSTIDGQILDANPAFAHMLGYSTQLINPDQAYCAALARFAEVL